MSINNAKKLLNFDEKFDVELMDNVMVRVFGPNGEQQRWADYILTKFKEHPDAWTRVDTILEYSQIRKTKFFALLILKDHIKKRWKVLPRPQCEGIRDYMLRLILKSSSEPAVQDMIYLHELNLILVQILKYEWPHNWPNFIFDIVGASQTNKSNDEVFGSASGNTTQTRPEVMKSISTCDLKAVSQLCQLVLDEPQNSDSAEAALNVLLRFSNWIPLEEIFETKLIPTLVKKYLSDLLFRDLSMKIFIEIAGLHSGQYDEQFVLLFVKTCNQLTKNLRKAAFKNVRDADKKKFLGLLCLFLWTFFKEHGALLELKAELQALLLEGLEVLLKTSEDDADIFATCLGYWNTLVRELYKERPLTSASASTTMLKVDSPPRRLLHTPVLSKLRRIIISRMGKPEEVLSEEYEQEELVQGEIAFEMSRIMRETLVYLTCLDYHDTVRIMTEKLHNQINGTEWSWKNLNALCWSIGAISGSVGETFERRFLTTVIEELFKLHKLMRDKDKAIVALNIMYLVRIYSQHLCAHWTDFREVVSKVFEFLHDAHGCVKDMACETLQKIMQTCSKHFGEVLPGEMMPFTEHILERSKAIICDLQPQEVNTLFGGRRSDDKCTAGPVEAEPTHYKFNVLLNKEWDDIIQQAVEDVDILRGKKQSQNCWTF